MTAEDIARDYPYLSQDDQGRALEIMNTLGAVMSLAGDAKSYPNDQARKGIGMQVAQLRASMISMLGQQA